MFHLSEQGQGREKSPTNWRRQPDSKSQLNNPKQGASHPYLTEVDRYPAFQLRRLSPIRHAGVGSICIFHEGTWSDIFPLFSLGLLALYYTWIDILLPTYYYTTTTTMKLSLALIVSSAAIAMALPQRGGDQGGADTAGGSAPATPGAPSNERSAGQPSSGGEQSTFVWYAWFLAWWERKVLTITDQTPGYSSVSWSSRLTYLSPYILVVFVARCIS